MRRLVALFLTALVLATLAPQAEAQTSEPDSRVRAQKPDSRLRGVGKRVVFSTGAGDARPSRFVIVRNQGGGTMNVGPVTITGTNASSFSLEDPAQDTTFSLGPDEVQNVEVLFDPSGAAGRYDAVLNLPTNEAPAGTVVQVRLKGLNADGYEMELEPTLYKILTTLGYEPGVGDPNRFPDGNLLPGLTYADEVNAPFWRKRKAENKVSMTPLGRYSTVIPNSCCIAGWFEQGTGTRHELQRFPGGPPPGGGQNQKIFPEATGRIEFSPPANFGIYANNEYSDQGGRPFRFFRARAINGSFRPGLWIVVQDQSGGDATGMVKNDDYNDFVWLLRNARPA